MPRKTADDRLHRDDPRGGFNEAAARCHGKRAPTGWAGPTRKSFNEAAARCHGKRGRLTAPFPYAGALQ